MKKNFFTWAITIYLIVMCAVVLKATIAPITHDESITILIWSSTDLINVWKMNTIHGIPADANNHIINSFLTKLSEKLFGFNEFAHRLPNVLSFTVFYIGLLLSLKLLSKDNTTILLSLSIGIFYIGFLDFFSLSRGYGISFALVMVSLQQSLSFIKTHRIVNLISSQAFSILGVLANFTSLNFYVAQLAVITLIILFTKKSNAAKELITLTISFIIGCLLITPPVLKLLGSGAFYFGSNSGLLRSVFGTMLKELSGKQSKIFELFIATLIILGLSYKFVDLIKNKDSIALPSTYFISILTLITISIYLQNIILSTPYITRRATLYLWPILYMFLISTFLELNIKARIKKIILISMNFIILLYFASNWSPIKTNEWSYDINTPSVYTSLSENCEKNPSTSIGVSWIYVPALNYQIIKDGMKCKTLAVRHEVITSPDFLYLTSADIEHKSPSLINYALIKKFTDGAELWARKQAVEIK